MRIMIKEVGKTPIAKEVESFGFRDMQDVVGGLLEHVSVSDTVDMWINDEGKLLGLPTNLFLAYNGRIYDSVQGDILFSSHDDEGETIGLSKDDEKVVMGMYNRLVMCHDPFTENSRVDLFPVLDLGGDVND